MGDRQISERAQALVANIEIMTSRGRRPERYTADGNSPSDISRARLKLLSALNTVGQEGQDLGRVAFIMDFVDGYRVQQETDVSVDPFIMSRREGTAQVLQELDDGNKNYLRTLIAEYGAAESVRMGVDGGNYLAERNVATITQILPLLEPSV